MRVRSIPFILRTVLLLDVLVGLVSAGVAQDSALPIRDCSLRALRGSFRRRQSLGGLNILPDFVHLLQGRLSRRFTPAG